MKITILCSLVCLSLLLVFSACNKLLGYSEGHGEPYIIPGTMITAIVGDDDSIVVTNDSAGNPISLIHSESPDFLAFHGYANFLLRYDSAERLTDLIALYGTYVPGNTSDAILSWDRFFYNSDGYIMKDSNYTPPWVLSGIPYEGSGTPYVGSYYYDTEHRVIRFADAEEQQDSLLLIDSVVYTYTYDNSGNMTGAGHDNKINFNRISKVWQFLDLDYSVNNPTSATYTYNSNGLPVSFTGTKSFINCSIVEKLGTYSAGKIYYAHK